MADNPWPEVALLLLLAAAWLWGYWTAKRQFRRLPGFVLVSEGDYHELESYRMERRLASRSEEERAEDDALLDDIRKQKGWQFLNSGVPLRCR